MTMLSNTTNVFHSLLASKSLLPATSPLSSSPSSNSSLDANIISLLPKVASNSLHQKSIGKFNNCHISCGKNMTEADYSYYSHGSGSDGGQVGAFRRYSLPILMNTKHFPSTTTTTTTKPELRQQRRNEAGLDIENFITTTTIGPSPGEKIWRKTENGERQFQFQDKIEISKTHRNCSIIQHLDSF